MVKYENGEYVPCAYKVILSNRGQEEIHYTDDKTYWQDMVAKHDHLTNLSFENISLTTEQQDRLQKVQNENIPQGFLAEVREYIESGKLPSNLESPLANLKYNEDIDNMYQMILENEGLI